MRAKQQASVPTKHSGQPQIKPKINQQTSKTVSNIRYAETEYA
jgi:hypothetical protein